METKKTITLYDNYEGYEFDEIKKEYLDMLTDEQAKEVTDREIYDYISFLEEDDFDCMLTEIKGFEDKNFPKWLCVGSVGTWHGDCDGGKVFDNFEEMIYSVTKDCDYIKVIIENGIMNIKCSHHDGTNYFSAKILTDKGVDLYNEWEGGVDDSEREIHQKMFNSDVYSNEIKELF